MEFEKFALKNVDLNQHSIGDIELNKEESEQLVLEDTDTELEDEEKPK